MPSHFVRGAKRIDDYPIHQFILPALVIEIADAESIKPAELGKVDINEGDALLFKTNNSRTGISRSPVPSDNWVYMTAEAADLCIDKKISLIGIDYLAPQKPQATIKDNCYPSKTLCAQYIDNREYFSPRRSSRKIHRLFCLPLKIHGGLRPLLSALF